MTTLDDSIVRDLGMPPSCFAERLLPHGIYEGVAYKGSKQRGHNVLMSCMRPRIPYAEFKAGMENISQASSH